MVFALYTHPPPLPPTPTFSATERSNAHHSVSLVSTESQESTEYYVAMLYIRSLLSDVIMCTSLSSLIKAGFITEIDWTACLHSVNATMRGV